jgi:hypothetical protein
VFGKQMDGQLVRRLSEGLSEGLWVQSVLVGAIVGDWQCKATHADGKALCCVTLLIDRLSYLL